MPAAKIAYAKQETYAFEKHYYELVSHTGGAFV